MAADVSAKKLPKRLEFFFAETSLPKRPVPTVLSQMALGQVTGTGRFGKKKFETFRQIFHAETSRIIFLFLVFYKLVRSTFVTIPACIVQYQFVEFWN